MRAKSIAIPGEGWDGTCGIDCPCGGKIEWAESAYAPGIRACRSCLSMYAVRGKGLSRKLVPQALSDDSIIRDAAPLDDIYCVPENLYPGWHQPIEIQHAERFDGME
jgi:hypothetical protein